ncbi:hypothetical protein PIB30_100865, partial [Stylosanthes scabra]|nr:hypothetical protein [Stylosanthes scabra]
IGIRMYALALKGKTSPKLLTAFSSSLTPQSFNPRGIDTHFTVVLLDTIRYTCRDLGFTNPSIMVIGAARASTKCFLGMITEVGKGRRNESFNAASLVTCMHGNRDKPAIQFDPEIKRTLRKLKKEAKQQATNQVFEEVAQNNMAAKDRNAQRRTLGEYTIPSTANCGCSAVRPNVEANNFELKPSLIQLV